MNADANKFTFAAPTAASSALYLSITNPTFEPLTKGSQGRFYFTPVSTWHANYAGQTVWEYTFGSNVAFDSADTVC